MTEDILFDGSGEMWSIMRAYDWKTSPLGPVDDWPLSLKTAVHILLSSRFSMWMAWGPELVFLYNDTYRKVTLGEKHPWALGRPAREVWSEIWGEINPRVQSVLSTGVATWDEGLLLFLQRSGFAEETYHTFSYSPLRDDDGKVAGMLCVVTEETDRVLGERQLTSLRRFSSELSTAITEEEVRQIVVANGRTNQRDLPFTLTYLVDEDERQARLFCATGFDDHDPAAPSIIELKSSSNIWPIAPVLEANDSLVLDVRDISHRLPSGAWEVPAHKVLLVPIAQRGQNKAAGVLIAGLSPYRILNGDYEGYIKLIAGQLAASLANADAYEQERKRAKALAEIDRAKTMFFSNVSHELRTPLTLMLGPLEDELARPGYAEEHKRSLELVHRNGLRMLKLVNTLLEFSRVESGRLNSRFEPIDLAALTAEYASAFRSAVERGGLRFVVDCRPLPDCVYVDREMWEKIMLNLLSNALKSTFQGEIAVTVRAVNGGAQLAVRDTGTGIPEDEVPHLFERFRRVEGARRRTHEGSGIGLALVRELVAMHGGAIGVETAVGSGTTFTVTLPFGDAHLPLDRLSRTEAMRTASSAEAYINEAIAWLPELFDNSHATAAPLQAVNGHEGDPELPRVLLADDNRDMRDYVSQLLSKKFRVEVAENGKIALELALRHVPHLILTDVMMPEMDGFQLLAAVRQTDSLKDVPVIMLSARAGEESKIDGLEAGADDYLVKPFTARELVARVTAHVSMARLRQDGAKRERELLVATQLERNRLQDLFLRAPASIAILSGPEHRFTLANERYLSIIGRKDVKEILGKTLAEALPELNNQDFPRLLDQVYKTGLPCVGNEQPALLARGRNGELEQAFVNFVYQPWRDSTGGIEGVFVHAIDATESVLARKAVEDLAASLQESEGRLRAIVEQVVSGICQIDLEGRLTFVNERLCEIARKTSEKLLGTKLSDLVHPEDQPFGRKKFCELIRSGQTYEIVQRYCRTGEGHVWVQNNFSAVLDRNGNVDSVVCVTQDVTERKLAEEALRRSEKLAAVGQLASTIAHEINNPLEAMTNLLYLMQGTQSFAELKKYAAAASEELLRVSHIVKTTLVFHRQPREATLEKISELLESAITIYQGRLRNADIQLIKSYKDTEAMWSSGGELRQVFANLVSNAFDATRNAADRRIIVRTRNATNLRVGARGVRVTIADTGCGMNEATVKHMFEPFFTTKGNNGSGLGLWVSLDILNKHQVSVRCRSREGRGTAFSLFFPVSDKNEESRVVPDRI